jgi:hypothetical protein
VQGNLGDDINPWEGAADKDPLKSPVAIVGLIAVLLPFFLHVSSSSSYSVNDVTVSSQYIDYVAVSGGAVGGLCGILMLLGGLGRKQGKGKALGIAAAICGLAIVQLLRGFGVIGA